MMSRNVWGVVLLSVVGVIVTSAAYADGGACDTNSGVNADEPKAAVEPAKAIKLQVTCPVTGGKIDKSLYVDHDGKRIYLCCKNCIAPVQKDPAKFIKAMEDSGVVLETVPVKK